MLFLNLLLYDDDEISTQKESIYAIIYPKNLKPRYHLFKIDAPENCY